MVSDVNLITIKGEKKKTDCTSQRSAVGTSIRASSLLVNGKLHSSPPARKLKNQSCSS